MYFVAYTVQNLKNEQLNEPEIPMGYDSSDVLNVHITSSQPQYFDYIEYFTDLLLKCVILI